MLGKRSQPDKGRPDSTRAPTTMSQGNNWWQIDQKKISAESKEKWVTMEHNGVSFPEDYQKHNAPIKYDKRRIEVSTFQEELATYWTQTLGTDWLKNPYYKKNFKKLFLNTFKEKPLRFKGDDKESSRIVFKGSLIRHRFREVRFQQNKGIL